MATTSGKAPTIVLGAMLAGGIVGCCGQARQCGTHTPRASECIAMSDTSGVPGGHKLPGSHESRQPLQAEPPARSEPPADPQSVLPPAPEPMHRDPGPGTAPPPPVEVEPPASEVEPPAEKGAVPPPPPLPGHAKARLRPGSGRVVRSSNPGEPRGLLYRLTGAPTLFSPSDPPPVESIVQEAEQEPMSADGPVMFRSPAEMRLQQSVSTSLPQPVTLLPPEPVGEDVPGELPVPGLIPVEHTFGHALP